MQLKDRGDRVSDERKLTLTGKGWGQGFFAYRLIEVRKMAWLLVSVLLIQVIGFFFLGNIRFAAGVPGDHWGMFFIEKFHPVVWGFIRNGWLLYVVCFIFFWVKTRSLLFCVAGFFLAIVAVAIFDFFVIPPGHDKLMFFRFDLIGLVIALSFVIFSSAIRSVFSKFSCEAR